MSLSTFWDGLQVLKTVELMHLASEMVEQAENLKSLVFRFQITVSWMNVIAVFVPQFLLQSSITAGTQSAKGFRAD